ncbi:MAG: PH domain-containing protein [Oscillospiraceae bacterium]|jgi:putative membrane protein
MSCQYRAHPITILGNLWRVVYLIIIPLLRGFFAALGDNLTGWLAGAWADVMILLLMVGIAVLRWWKVTYRLEGDTLSICSGVVFQRETLIPWRKIVTISVMHPFYLHPFRAVRLRVDTMGGSRSNADFTVILSPNNAAALLQWGKNRKGQGGLPRGTGAYTPRTSSILALSLLNSNSLAGIVFISALISQSGRLLGVEFSRLLIDTFEETARTLAFGIPPAAAALAYLLLGGWVVSFIHTFLRYKNMQVSRQGDHLHIVGGTITSREYLVKYGEVNFIDIRQSLTTKVMGLYSLYISAVGYGKQKEDITCLVPTEGEIRFRKHRTLLFPALTPAARSLPASKRGILRFLAQPLCLCLGVPTITGVLIWLMEGWTAFALFVGSMAMVPCVVFLLARIFDYRTGGLARQGEVFTLRYSKGFYLHTVVVQRDKMVQVELRQGFFQRFGGTCDVLVRTRGEGRILHRCRALDRKKAEKLFA